MTALVPTEVSTAWLARFRAQCVHTSSCFTSRVLPLQFEQRGITLSEGLAFCAMCDLFDIQAIVESGVAGGRSTEIWGRYFDGPIVAVDHCKLYGGSLLEATQRRLAHHPNIRLVVGDSSTVIPALLGSLAPLRTALFIDGPKGARAMALAEACFRHASPPLLVGIHDMCRELDNHLMDRWPSTLFYTDDPEFRAEYGHLDQADRATTIADGRLLGDAYRDGPVLGVALNPFGDGRAAARREGAT